MNAELSEGSLKPKLLPSGDHFTKLVINSVHKENLHSGVSQTLAEVRQEYWIPKGRMAVRSVLQSCCRYIRISGGTYKSPTMAAWPRERMSKAAPFTYTGIDYFGPLYIKCGNADQSKKVWVCLFTCLGVRAVHLEMIDDMSAEQFLLCLRRFIAIRGKPEKIISDNAPQFKLVKRALDLTWSDIIHDKDIISYAASKGIEWKFIIEFAPWMGGVYERMVGLVKMSLKKAIGKVRLTSVQLQTVLAEVQAVVNSRPLTYVGEDINSTIPLRPIDFLSLNPKVSLPHGRHRLNEGTGTDPDYQEEKELSSAEKLLQTWKNGQVYLNRFWDIWQDSYLLSLRERNQHKLKQGRILAPKPAHAGDIVLIKESCPRGSWKMGKIQQLIPSKDGQIRAAKVLLPNHKCLTRPINLLCPLECHIQDQDIDSAEDKNINSDGHLDGHSDSDEIVSGTVHGGNGEIEPRPKRQAAAHAKEKLRQWLPYV